MAGFEDADRDLSVLAISEDSYILALLSFVSTDTGLIKFLTVGLIVKQIEFLDTPAYKDNCSLR